MVRAYAVAVGLMLWAAAAQGGEESRGQEPSVKLGLVARVEVSGLPGNPKILMTRVVTQQGRSYYAYGVMQGAEGTELSKRLSRSGVEELCAGRPLHCSQMMK